MAVRILKQDESWRLIEDGRGRYAVVEARAGHVYSLHPEHRRSAEDSEDGMLAVVGDDGWSDQQAAEDRFAKMVRREQHYARTIW